MSPKKIFLIWILCVVVFILLFQLIISSFENKQNQRIKVICNDKMIKFRSCDDLAFGRRYCDSAQKQYEENNCTTIMENWLWQKK